MALVALQTPGGQTQVTCFVRQPPLVDSQSQVSESMNTFELCADAPPTRRASQPLCLRPINETDDDSERTLSAAVEQTVRTLARDLQRLSLDCLQHPCTLRYRTLGLPGCAGTHTDLSCHIKNATSP
jgi:hypothetical protein